MSYIGKIYRPWTEAESLLIQVTVGCSINTCTFCSMFRDKSFRRRPLEDIFADIENFRRMYPHVESIFLIDGNVMVLKTDFLLKVINKIKETFPELKNLAMYAGFTDFKRKTVEQLKEIKDAGLTLCYNGLETGDPEILAQINKRTTAQDIIDGAALAKDAGIPVLQSFIFGLGGKERSKEHIEGTTRLLNITQPELIAPMAMAVQPGTELFDDIKSGAFVQATPLQILQEEEYLLQNMDEFETFYLGDHGNNIVPQTGWMPYNRELFLKNVQHAIATNPVTQQETLDTFTW